MQLNVNGAQAIEVSDATFGGDYNETLVHQAVVAYMAGGRQGSKHRRLVPTYPVAVSAHGVRKVLAVLVLVLLVVRSGVAVV